MKLKSIYNKLYSNTNPILPYIQTNSATRKVYYGISDVLEGVFDPITMDSNYEIKSDVSFGRTNLN